MASHRKPHPAGTGGTGFRTPALATAALTSVAVLSQTAEPAHAADDGRPSVEEVEKKIDDFYRGAESAAERQETGRERGGQRGRSDTPREKPTAPEPGQQQPQDYFHQSRLMDRLASNVRRRQQNAVSEAERAKAGVRSGETPPAAGTPRTPGAARPSWPAGAADTAAAAGTAGMPEAPQAPRAPRASRGERSPETRHDPLTAPGVDAPIRALGVDAPVRTPRASHAPEARQVAPGIEMPTQAPYDPSAAKAAVQRKLASARGLLAGFAARTGQVTRAGQASQAGTTAWRDSAGAPAAAAPTAAPSATTKAEKAIAFARAQIGKPYVWGASGPGSYDSTGLTQAAWKAAGVTIPRGVHDQANAGTAIPVTEARPGDLVFFHDDGSHVGLYLGDGMMIHAPRPGEYVREDPVHTGTVVHSVVRPA